jgi:AcrR family transcriptional regulator
MSKSPANKHAERSAQTRARFVEAAQALFAERGIDSVSLSEITVAAGQKNRNALQYHFGNRAGLLQAIIDSHAPRVHAHRQRIIDEIEADAPPPASAAARALVQPLTDYVQESEQAIFYVKILSQMAMLGSPMLDPEDHSGFSFKRDTRLYGLFGKALVHLEREERQHRIFLSLSLTFHGIADICRSTGQRGADANREQRAALFDQVMLAVESLLAAPPRSG